MDTCDLLLAKAIIDNDIAKRIVDDLDVSYFGKNNAAVVFETIKEILDKKIDVSVSSVIEFTEKKSSTIKDYLLLLMREAPVINYDQCIDSVKRDYSRKLISSYAKDIISICKEGCDVSDIIKKIQQANNVLMTKKDDSKKISDFAEEGCEKLFANEEFIKTGIPKIDNVIRGFTGGQLIIIAARPSMGKSTLGLQIASHMDTESVLYCLEMKGKDNYARLVSQKSGVAVSDIIAGNAGRKESIKKAEEELKSNNLEIVDNIFDLKELMADARRRAKKKKIKAFFFDYLQIIKNNSRKNRYEQVGEISRALKELAMETNTAVIPFAQLSRKYEVENRPPQLSDLRESGDIEQDADIVMFIHSEDEKSKPVMDVDIILAKGRNFGLGSCKMKYDKPRFLFREESAADYRIF